MTMEEADGNIPPLLLLLLLLIPILFSTIFILKSHLKKKNNSKTSFPLPPGPWKLPIIGNIHQLAASAGPIHRRLADLAQQHGPIMHLQLGETSNVIVSSPESAREFLKTHDRNFALRPHVPSADIIFYGSRDIAFSGGDYWRKMRKICTTEILTDKRVKSLRPILEAEASKLVKLIGSEPAGGVVNLSRLLLSVGNAMTSRTAFGKVRELEGSFLPVIHRIFQALDGFRIGDIFPSNRLLRLISGTERHLKKLHQEADVILQEVIDEHVSRRSRETEHLDKSVAAGEEDEDLVDVLLACTDNHIEVKAVILDIFLAGGDTSPVLVEWAMSELMKNPEKMDKVQREVREVFDKRGKAVDEACFNELHYLKSVVKETSRLHPPAPLSLPREGRETVVINGCQIPMKTRVIVNFWAIGRDPSHWTQPDQFIPERFLNSSIDYKGNDFPLIPFGAGRRMCPGMNYGVAVGCLLLANLLYHFDWKLPNQIKPQDLDMSEGSGASVPRKNNLYLNPIPYHAP